MPVPITWVQPVDCILNYCYKVKIFLKLQALIRFYTIDKILLNVNRSQARLNEANIPWSDGCRWDVVLSGRNRTLTLGSIKFKYSRFSGALSIRWNSKWQMI